ncbi:MAG: C40 family peptidase [Weeksellaceae bacterium]|jgi:lipoprotein Spr|nr:C40 family peptidase [Weeksellaceae bacterium]MDX9704507.1 C40 family peptidase [Weeksellaceae bacterium]
MKGINLLIIVSISILTTSCGTLISANQPKSDYPVLERSYYAQTSILNKKLYSENKIKEVKSTSSDSKVPNTLDELKDIHKIVLGSFVYQILSEAESYLGTPYRYGGTTRKGIDCSSFVQSVFQIFDYELPRISAAQAKEGRLVSNDELRAGDLVFFATSGKGRVSHVGIVHNVSDEGEVEFIHASTSQGVIVTPLSSAYWSKRYLYAKRIID